MAVWPRAGRTWGIFFLPGAQEYKRIEKNTRKVRRSMRKGHAIVCLQRAWRKHRIRRRAIEIQTGKAEVERKMEEYPSY